MPLLMEDRELLAAFKRGDPAALERVYLAYREAVVALLRHGFEFESGDQHLRFRGYSSAFDVLDAVQETFTRAFAERARASYSGLTPYGPYVRQIARNFVIDECRRQSREALLLAAQGPGGEETSAPGGRRSPESQVLERQTQELVRRFLASLTELERRIVEAHFERGLSQEAVTAELALTRHQVRKCLETVKRRLLKLLAREGFID